MMAVIQGSRFVAIGVVQVLIDSGVFISLTALGMPTPLANLCSRLGGATVGFWLNGRITFAQQQQPAFGPRFLRYATLWVVMTILSTSLLTIIASDAGLVRAWWSKPLLEGALGIGSFLISRYWVYRQRPQSLGARIV